MSFVFASAAGYFALCFSYWLIDVKRNFWEAQNSSSMWVQLYIYLPFCQLGGDEILIKTFNPIFKTFFHGRRDTCKYFKWYSHVVLLLVYMYWMYKTKFYKNIRNHSLNKGLYV